MIIGSFFSFPSGRHIHREIDIHTERTTTSLDDTPSKCMPPPRGHSRRYLLASYSVSIS